MLVLLNYPLGGISNYIVLEVRCAIYFQ